MGRREGVVGGEAAVGVRGGVGEAEVGFDFGDAAGETVAVEIADEELAEEGSGDDVGGAGVEGLREEFRVVAGFWECAHILGAGFLELTSYIPTRRKGAYGGGIQVLWVGHLPR